MSFSVWINRLLIVSLMLITLIIVLVSGKIKLEAENQISSNLNPDSAAWSPTEVRLQAAQEEEKQPQLSVKSLDGNTPDSQPTAQTKSLNNQVSNQDNLPQASFKITKAFEKYKPRYEIALAHPNNYGERYGVDINGVQLNNQAIIVIHETGDSASSAINTFRIPYEDSEKQVSYHSLIKLDGTVIYIVPPDKRAFGAANSVFDGENGLETVQTNPGLPASVNNFAYHVSLETPPEGRNREPSHTGYTDAQYYSLAWLVAQSSVPDARITTHKAVDRSGQRSDPRSFDFDKFFRLLHAFRQPIAISKAN